MNGEAAAGLSLFLGLGCFALVMIVVRIGGFGFGTLAVGWLISMFIGAVALVIGIFAAAASNG